MGWKQRTVERPDGSLLEVDSWRPGGGDGWQFVTWIGYVAAGAGIALLLRALHASGITP